MEEIKAYKAIKKQIGRKEEINEFLEQICTNTNNLYNVTNYYIRQLYFGKKKIDEGIELKQNEKEIYEMVNRNLQKLDERSIKHLQKKITKLEELLKVNPKDETISQKLEQLQEKLIKFKPHTLSESGFPSYELLEGIFKTTNNLDYKALPTHVAQQTMKQCFQDWRSFFNSIKEYNVNPEKFKAEPKIPKYKKKGGKSMARFTNLSSFLKFKNNQCWLYFTGCDSKLFLGEYIKPTDVLQQVEILPFYGEYKITLILKDKTYEKKECESTRMLGIDLGINNFATISNNIGMTPMIIKGNFIKSKNQYFNKTRSLYLSKLQKGQTSTTSQKSSKKLNTLSKNRNNFMNDCFYKIAHKIIDIALINKIDTIVIGHNKNQKQDVNLSKQNNQNFVSIPFNKFINILGYLCLKNNLQFIITEESYTSKSSILDNDILPIYDKNDTISYTFSGKRISRGLYKTKDGIILNSDINGASNIIRKVNLNAFDGLDLSYLQTTSILNYFDFYPSRKF